MAKKRTKVKSKKREYNSDPFSDLKGFVFSAPEINKTEIPEKKQSSTEVIGTFSDEMEMLGVKKLNMDTDSENEPFADSSESSTPLHSEPVTDEEIFLTAMSELTVSFRDNLPDHDLQPTAEQRRIKQLKRGKLSPEASLDLHGCQRSEVVQKLTLFLKDSLHQGRQTVLVITGKGLHSESGTAVLRDEVEHFLSSGGKKYVVEWTRSPKQYGGEGAIVLFLRKKVKM
ncbi:DNA-nicking endonuclease, Smr domain [Desulfuromusa kysingii]|uniref:DNA-nicking endonuclease, Smr domain n=1 Tax=Desulfuromusa kysingii TaxID=37625 RepID=A0A1H4C1B4_9BACT|nr:Smr/MutS family protein [Desulfuromusa kysingii]SEA54103.1 DNA-nicking endonuclease, Smr domain [Desulfuromusa kysingii]